MSQEEQDLDAEEARLLLQLAVLGCGFRFAHARHASVAEKFRS